MRLGSLSSFSFASVLLATAALSPAFAATTPPVGAVSKNLVAGTQILSVPFQSEAEYQGTVDLVADEVVALTGLPSLSDPAYLHVISGSAAGKVSTIMSSDGATVTLESAIAGLAISDSVVIRRHVTLADVSTYISVNQGDIITLFNSDGSQLISQYFSGYGWYAGSLNANTDAVPVYPGEAFVLTTSVAREVTFYGSVTTDPVVFPLAGNNRINLIGTMEPIAGETVANTFPNAVNGNIFSAYTSNAGIITNAYNAQYFEGFGWYNSATNSYVDNELINTGTGAVISVSSASDAVLPAAYAP